MGLGVASGCELQHKMLVTDQLEMLGLMKRNIELNGLEATTEALVLNWYVGSKTQMGCADMSRGESLPQAVVDLKPNIILAGECVYFEPAFPLLMQTLRDLMALNSAAVIYLCFKKRRRADLQFVKMAKKAFKVEEIYDEDRPVFQRRALYLFSFRAKA